MKSLKLSQYFQIIKPQYTYLKIIPDKSIRNYNSSNVSKAIAHTFRTLDKKIKIEQKKLIIEADFKISFLVDIEKNNSSFYFILPEFFLSVLVEKIREIWSKATLEIAESPKPFTSAGVYQLSYKKENALSLAVDKKSNEPLNSILNVMEIMKDDDRVGVLFNCLPRSQFGWIKEYDDTMDKIKEHKPIEREKGTKYLAKNALNIAVGLMESVLDVLNDFTGGKPTDKKKSLYESILGVLAEEKQLSIATKKKKEQTILDTQLLVISESKDNTRRENNALSICQSYRVLDEDNELTYKKIKTDTNFDKYKYNADINTISTDEAQNFIQVPGRTLLRQFKINHVNTNECPIPAELTKGFFNLGKVKYKGETAEAYLENEYNVGNLPLVLIGSQGSGKTTFMQNIALNCNRNKEGLFILDFIKNCNMSNDIAKVIPQNDLVIIDLAKESDLQGLGYNEISIQDNMTAYEKLNLANLQSQQVMALVDSISIGDPLSSRMRRFLNSACNIVLSQGYSSIKNVVECLENYKKRTEYIKSINEDLKELLEDDINTLQELDEYSKASKDTPSAIVGTKDNKIEHILDRISMLREDFKLKYMYNKPSKDNINLVELTEQGKTVIIQMKENDFPTKMIKNILITYWVSKIWLTSQLRGRLHDKPKRTNIIIDEVFQAPTSMNILEYILPQSRKFGAKFIFSTQYIKQLESIFDTLEASGCSYMLLKGSMEDDFNHFKNKLEEFEFDDLRDMERYHSLNLIYYSKGYSSFISKLPAPLKTSQGNALNLY